MSGTKRYTFNVNNKEVIINIINKPGLKEKLSFKLARLFSKNSSPAQPDKFNSVPFNKLPESDKQTIYDSCAFCIQKLLENSPEMNTTDSLEISLAFSDLGNTVAAYNPAICQNMV